MLTADERPANTSEHKADASVAREQKDDTGMMRAVVTHVVAERGYGFANLVIEPHVEGWGPQVTSVFFLLSDAAQLRDGVLVWRFVNPTMAPAPGQQILVIIEPFPKGTVRRERARKWMFAEAPTSHVTASEAVLAEDPREVEDHLAPLPIIEPVRCKIDPDTPYVITLKFKQRDTSYGVSSEIGQILVPTKVLSTARITIAKPGEHFEVHCFFDEEKNKPVATKIRRM